MVAPDGYLVDEVQGTFITMSILLFKRLYNLQNLGNRDHRLVKLHTLVRHNSVGLIDMCYRYDGTDEDTPRDMAVLIDRDW